ncbi:MAG: hypothetical protein JNJ83_23560 [Verrucomicrobiaceae bacterium]|nr:hypothetical protein [Verrucomicrobiaceae bacterium]
MEARQNPASGLFPSTIWSMVANTHHEEDGVALRALDRLARAYWKPLFVFVRQRGTDPDKAADLVQGFFHHLLSREVLADLEQRTTRFRSFLLACFCNWLSNQRRDANTEQRGGKTMVLPLEELATKEDAALILEGISPEQGYDRHWARTLFDHALAHLDEEIAARDQRREFFVELRKRMVGPAALHPDWDALARQFGMQHGAVRKAMHDLRQRFAKLLREEVRKLVADDSEVEDEIRYLVHLLTHAGR